MGFKTLLVATLFLAALVVGVVASDPELTSDFAVPVGLNASNLNGSFFTSTLLRNVSANTGNFATVTPVNLGVFPALQGLGVSSALLQYPVGAQNVPHIHPRGTEVLYIIEGTLDVGLIDTTNKLFTQTLQQGDIFVFPKGLVHYQINSGQELKTVRALAAFSSSNPGLVRLPNTLFKSQIQSDILSEAFGVSTEIIEELKMAVVN